MKTGKIITDLRKSKDWSQGYLAKMTGISQVMVGKYERGDAIPSIEVAKKIADALGVSLDYLVGEGINSKFDKNTLKRIEEIEQLDSDKKRTLFDVIDTFIRESKGRKAFAER
jgi:transcriptional regulator with XRE-family HTH domain